MKNRSLRQSKAREETERSRRTHTGSWKAAERRSSAVGKERETFSLRRRSSEEKMVPQPNFTPEN